MELVQRMEGAATVLAVTGRLDAVTAPEFEAKATAVIGGGATKLVLDLAALEYVSSAGLRALLVAAKLAQGAGGGVAFAGVHGTVQSVFTMSGFAKMFPMSDSVEAATAALG